MVEMLTLASSFGIKNLIEPEQFMIDLWNVTLKLGFSMRNLK